MTGWARGILTTTLCLSMLWATGTAADDTREPAFPQGLEEVGLTVERVSAEAELDGLSWNLLRTQAEGKLRRGGLRVLSLEEVGTSLHKPILHVHVATSRKRADGLYAYVVGIHLRQAVSVIGGPSTVVYATTWSSTESLGIATAEDLSGLSALLGGKLDEFLRACRGDKAKKKHGLF